MTERNFCYFYPKLMNYEIAMNKKHQYSLIINFIKFEQAFEPALHMTFEKNKYLHMKNLFTIILLSSFGIFFSQEKDILKVLHTQQTAWNNGDIENFMKGYWKDDSLLFIGSKGPTYGWQKTLDNYKKTYPNKEMMGVLEFSDIHVKMLGKKHAYVFGKWKLIRANDTPNGIYTLVFQKFNDGWKIISDHTN